MEALVAEFVTLLGHTGRRAKETSSLRLVIRMSVNCRLFDAIVLVGHVNEKSRGKPRLDIAFSPLN